MKTDAQLKKDVEAELEWEPAVEAAHIGVAVKDGVVTVNGNTAMLRGQVHSWAERNAAQGAAFPAPGITSVLNELKVTG
jgi:osmotically-inducible protein OsmY